MTCPTSLELSRAISEGDPAIDAHVATCDACRAEWRATEVMIELARELGAPPPAAAHREQVRTTTLAASRVLDGLERGAVPIASRSRRRAIVVCGTIAVAAAAAIALVVLRGDDDHHHGAIAAIGDARFVTTSAAPDEVVKLYDGTIVVDVAPLHRGERFRVVVGAAEIEVHGTAFTVNARGGELVDVVVEHGLVEVRPPGAAPLLLRAGETWRAPQLAGLRPAPSGAEIGAALPDDRAMASAGSARDRATAPATTGTSMPSTATSVPEATTGTIGVPEATTGTTGADRGAVAPAKTGPSAASSPATGNAARAGSAPPATGTSVSASGVRDGGAATPATTGLESSVPSPADDRSATGADGRPPSQPLPPPEESTPAQPQERAYDDAWSSMRASRFDDAATKFLRVQLLDPEGPLAEDASYWRAVALARAKSSAAAQAFRDFLELHPRSRRAGEASAMLGWILVDAREHAEAKRRFQAALTDGRSTPAVVTSARAGLAALAPAP